MGGAFRIRSVESVLWSLFTAGLIIAVASAFYWPGIVAAGGWPAPLDDTYIYLGFARSWALGSPFEWFPGNGYSSGCTSWLYPILLAPAYAFGLSGRPLLIWAAALAVLFLFDLCRSARQLVLNRWTSWLTTPLLLSVPLLCWSFFSGMETALLAAVMGRCLVATRLALDAPAGYRDPCQLRLGLWLAVLMGTRPEMLVLALSLGLVAAHGARSLSTLGSVLRCVLPLAVVVAGQGVVNQALTGEWAPAGGVRKLIWSVPYTDPAAGVIQVLKNLFVLGHQGLLRALGGTPMLFALLLLCAAAVTNRRTRQLAMPLIIGAVGCLALVSLNSTARYQNYRYAAPVLAMVLSLGALGAGAWLSHRRRRSRTVLGVALILIAVVAPLGQLDRQVGHFAQASANIEQQHGEIARRLNNRTPRPRRILVNDAGAIPFLTEIPPIDGLGLGGFRRLPFARASVHGLPAVVELIERLDEDERPDVLALYPTWWRGVADVFGRPVDRVQIRHNVICGADEKVIYEADWSRLSPSGQRRRGEIDSVDVADLVSERAHDYRFPAPHGGWVIAPQEGAAGLLQPYDAGRLIPAGKSESFTLRETIAEGEATLILRTDAAGSVLVQVVRQHQVIETARLEVQRSQITSRGGDWLELHARLASVRGGDRLRFSAHKGPWRSFHTWLVRR